jgi:hypothetical protein
LGHGLQAGRLNIVALVAGEGEGVEAASGAGSAPEALAFGVESGFVLRQPFDGVIEADGGSEGGLVSEVEKDEGGDESVFISAADGVGGPGTLVLLKGGKIGDSAFDDVACALIAHQGAETESRDDQIAPAAVAFLGCDDRADQFCVERVKTLIELVHTDKGHGGSGDGMGQVGDQAMRKLESAGEQLAREAVVLPGVPKAVDLARSLHGVPFLERHSLGELCPNISAGVKKIVWSILRMSREAD